MNKETDLTKVPLVKLANMLDEAFTNEEQEIINLIACEIARRFYVPEAKVSYEEFKAQFGYKKLEKEKKLIKRIDLYEE